MAHSSDDHGTLVMVGVAVVCCLGLLIVCSALGVHDSDSVGSLACIAAFVGLFIPGLIVVLLGVLSPAKRLERRRLEEEASRNRQALEESRMEAQRRAAEAQRRWESPEAVEQRRLDEIRRAQKNRKESGNGRRWRRSCAGKVGPLPSLYENGRSRWYEWNGV